MKTFCLDTETTSGSERGRVVQFAIVDHEYRGEWLINPPTRIEPGTIKVHKITPDMVADKPRFFESEGYSELQKRLDAGEVMIAHHAPFDISILANEGVHITKYIDTCKVARALLYKEGVPRFGLQFLKDHLKLEARNAGDILTGYAHSALYDTVVLYWLYKYLYEYIEHKYPGQDPDEYMYSITNDIKAMKIFRFGKYKGRGVAEIAMIDKGYLEWLYKSELDKPLPKQSKSVLQGIEPYIGIKTL